MGKFIPAPELSLDLRPIFVPKTISQFLGEVARICSVSEKILKIDDFVSRLETEIRKIDVFKRELPLCMLLMNDAIVALKEELMVFKNSAKQPVLEEFIPLNKTCDDDNNDDDDDVDDEDPKSETDNSDKKNWLSSTHLWNTNEINSDTNQNQISKQNSVEKVIQKEPEKEQYKIINDSYCGKSERDLIPFREENHVPGLSLSNLGMKNSITRNDFLTKSGANNNNDSNNLAPYSVPDVNSDIQIGTPQPQQHTSRKQRRCWSTELHRRFVNALQQLGGSKVATPKQIRELMRVDGLTNDEVKSHLQKYRLHARRPPYGVGSWGPQQDHYLEKQMNSQSGSPDGPLANCTTTGGDSLDDGDDEKSVNNSWKSHLHTSRKHNV